MTSPHRTLSRRFARIGGAALVAACGSSSMAPNMTPLAGTFTLRTVNGSQLPFVVQSGEPSLTIVADVITIADGGTWTETGTFRVTENGVTNPAVVSDGGPLVRSGSSISLQSSGSGKIAYSGTFTNMQLTLTDDIPLTYLFSK